jgi:hypothetical protein
MVMLSNEFPSSGQHLRFAQALPLAIGLSTLVQEKK